MSILSMLGIGNAYAAAAIPATEGGWTSMLLMIVIFAAFVYIMIIRPQSKRAKEHRSLMASLKKGDEVVTSGGLLGKIIKVVDNFMVVTIAEGVDITIQKPSVVACLPKGTIKSI